MFGGPEAPLFTLLASSGGDRSPLARGGITRSVLKKYINVQALAHATIMLNDPALLYDCVDHLH